MRVTGGIARGRTLSSPKPAEATIRPTCDRVREALFSILARKVPQAIVLDLFAGTGALGIEALSRGAGFALFADQSLAAGRLIEANLKACFTHPQAGFVRLNLATATSLAPLLTALPAGVRFDLIFMDPPYQKNLAARLLPMVERDGLLAPDARVIVEEHQSVELPSQVGTLHLTGQRRYGETGLWIYKQLSSPA